MGENSIHPCRPQIQILKKDGWIEIWVPDGLKIATAFIEAENGNHYLDEDGWYKFNQSKDPCLWASGRIFTYGSGDGNPNHPNWHRALFSQRFLIKLFEKVGLRNIEIMSKKQVRGYDHKWINLGIRGQK